jgi:hypothetical protein
MPIAIDGNGTITGISTGGIDVTESITAQSLGNGAIIQIAHVRKSDTWTGSTAEGAFSSIITGLTQSFTCSSASNKVLILGCLHVENPIGGGWGVGAVLTADGSDITASAGDARGSNRVRVTGHMPTGYLGGPLQIEYLHSPSSTSAVTYGVKLWNGHTSTQTLALNHGTSWSSDVNNDYTCASSFTFMEVVA